MCFVAILGVGAKCSSKASVLINLMVACDNLSTV